MKTTLLLLLASVVTQAKEERSWVGEVRAWAESNFNGVYLDFNENVPYLDSYDFDNTIASVRVTGVWIFYEEPEYNTYTSGLVHWTWGLDYLDPLQDNIHDKVSSLRHAGSQEEMNADGYNLYYGQAFTGHELYQTNDIPDLTVFHQEVASAIIIGTSSWTFCESKNYLGRCSCLYARLHAENANDRLDVGFYPSLPENEGLYQVLSIKKGCN